jgi:hypothetical protein
MTHEQTHADEWKQTSVFIRMDIYKKAGEKGFNISDECNRALASLLGIEYGDRVLTEMSPAQSADTYNKKVISSEKKPVSSRPLKPLRPVMDAEEIYRKGLAHLREHKPSPPREEEPPVSASSHSTPSHPLPVKPKKKQGKEYVTVRKFYETRVVPVEEKEGADTRISKDEMYQAFLKWSVSHSLEPVPDKKMFGELLKKRFNIPDLNVKGRHYWVKVQLR